MEDLFKALAMHVDEGVFVIRDRHFIFCNAGFARILGRQVGEVVGVLFTEVVAPEDLDMVADRYRRRWAGEPVPPEYEFRLLHRDGSTRIPVWMWTTVGEFDGARASMAVVRTA